MKIDVTEVKSISELHQLFKQELQFPDYYGMNWDAFWDSITGLIQMPEMLIIYGFDKLQTELPKDSEILSEIIEQYNKIGNNHILIQ